MRVNFVLILCGFALLTPLIPLQRAYAANESSERVWVDENSDSSLGVTRYFSLHQEDGQWWLESFDVRPGEFQRFVSRKSFDRPQDAIDVVHRQIPQAVESTEQSSTRAISPSPITELPGRTIWKVENAWDWSWELRYSDWVKENIKADFFQKYNIGVDCADVAFSARWIFSRIHHLPAANTLSATGALFTQDAMLKEWETLPQAENWNEDRLFMTALKYVLDNTYTHTLMRDSYPISIVKEAFLPGTQHLSLTPESGHTYVVSAVDLSENSAEPIQVIYSTVPSQARRLLESGFWDAQQPTQAQGGFVRFRWPEKSGEQWVLKPADQMMFYSTDQYARSFMNGFGSFAEAVAVKLNPHLDFKARLQNAINTIIERIRTRATIVENGEKVCAVENCNEGTANYENWSTPLRDQSLRETIHSLEEYADRMSDRVPGLSEIWSANLQKPALTLQGIEYSLGAIAYAWKIGSFSSDPKQPSDARWGLSGDAFRKFVRTQLKEWFNERAQKLKAQGAACSSACKSGSPEWQSWQSFELDEKIQALALSTASYCDYAPKSECDGFESKIDSDRVRIENRTKSLRDWIELAPWLNSDPTLSPNERWGSVQEKYFSHLTYPGDVLKISRAGWMLDRPSNANSSPILENTINGKQVRSPKDFNFTNLDLETGLVVSEKTENGSKEILVADPDHVKLQMKLSVSPNTDSTWLSSSRLALSDEHSVRFFDCSQSPCVKQLDLPTVNRPKMNELPISGVFIVQQDLSHFSLIDTRTPDLKHIAFEWKDFGRSVPDSISLETQDWLGGMATISGHGDNVDRRQFFVRKSDGKVILPIFSAGTEYLLHLSRNGKWGILAHLYEDNEAMTLVELDANFKVRKRMPIGKEVNSAAPSCRDESSDYFLAEDTHSPFKRQYYRLSDKGLAMAPLLADEVEVKAGCRDEIVLKTLTGERLRKWGSPKSRFESAAIEFLAPQPEEQQIRWVIASPSKDSHQSELFDLGAWSDLGTGFHKPVLTGDLALLGELEDPNSSSVRSGHVISVGQNRLLWIRNSD